MSTVSSSQSRPSTAAASHNNDKDLGKLVTTSRKHTPDYTDECLHLDAPPEPWAEPVSSLMLRKGSCETQWVVIKKRFMKWKENGQKNIVHLTVANDIGIARQIDNSERLLCELHADGDELITNVRRANDAREAARRADEDCARAQLIASMRAESAESARRVAAIAQRWSQLGDFKEPMGLYDALGQQKQRIGELMAQKDGLIEELHEAVRAADRRYVADQETQTGDIGQLVDRIDRQVEVMREAYRQHLEILQQTVDGERQLFKRTEAERWHALYADRDAVELAGMRETARTYGAYEAELAAVARQHLELNRETKIRLERENDALQVELRSSKAEVLLNSEKLTYNHKVLQHRTDENAIVKAQQKRRLNRLYEVVAQLRGRHAVAVQQGSAEVGRLTADVIKLYGNVMELDAKAEAFAAANEQKYRDIWAVHEAECGQLLQQYWRFDARICEQHLGIAVAGCMRNGMLRQLTVDERYQELLLKRPKGSAKPQLRTQSAHASTVAQQQPRRLNSPLAAASSSSSLGVIVSLEAQVVEVILQKIATHTEWLQDNALFNDTMRFELDEHVARVADRLIRIDHVFNALGLSSAPHVQALMRHFLPNVFCERCQAKPAGGGDAGGDHQRQKNHCGEHERHEYVIEESLVVPTLRTYVEQFYQRECAAAGVRENNHQQIGADDDEEAIASGSTSRKNQQQRRRLLRLSTATRQIRPKDVADFWHSFVAQVPAHRDRLWTALEGGMAKYLQVLKKRERIDAECEFLRKQNAELGHLLLRYLPNKPEEQY